MQYVRARNQLLQRRWGVGYGAGVATGSRSYGSTGCRLGSGGAVSHPPPPPPLPQRGPGAKYIGKKDTRGGGNYTVEMFLLEVVSCVLGDGGSWIRKGGGGGGWCHHADDKLWPTGPLAHWLTISLVHWFTGSLARWLAGSLARWLTGSLAHWLAGSLTRWLTGSLAHWLTGSLARWLAGSLAHWLAGSLARWLTGSLAHWLTVECLAYIIIYNY